jgi:hypothetical protein
MLVHHAKVWNIHFSSLRWHELLQSYENNLLFLKS